MIDAKTLRLVTRNGLQGFATGYILDGIAALRTLLPYCTAETILSAEAESLERNYHSMLLFLRGGGSDEKRYDVQEKIQKRGVALLEQANRAIRISLGGDLYCNALSRLNEVYGGRDALLDKWNSILTPEETSDVQDDLFDLLWTSPLWTAEDTAFWYDFLMRQREMVQQHLEGAIFLSLWEHYDAEKILLLNFLADSECPRTRLEAVSHLLLLRIRHKEVAPLMPSLPASLLSREGKKLVTQVWYEFLLMLISEKDMEKELREAESITKELLSAGGKALAGNIKDIISLRGRYLRNRLARGLDINLSKIPLLHGCKYLRRESHWFMPFDKTHPLFQSVMIDKDGNEKQHLSTLVDFILDCDIDKMATLYLVSNDKDFSKAFNQLDEQELPDIENAAVPEYTVRFVMQDLFRFFGHSPLHSQLINPFRENVTLFDFPELATLFSIEDTVSLCELLYELGRSGQTLRILDDAISREGACASALLLKGQALMQQKKYAEAASQGRSAEILEPENTDILRFLVECYAQQGRHEEELEYLQKLAELMPEDKALSLLIATAMDKAGRQEEALALYFKLDYEASQDEENYAGLVSSIARTALALDKLDISERYTKKELELTDGRKWEAHLRMGHIRLLRGDWKGAIDSYSQFAALFPEGQVHDIDIATARFTGDWEMLIRKGIRREDLLLIHDVLQANADSPGSVATPGHTEE